MVEHISISDKGKIHSQYRNRFQEPGSSHRHLTLLNCDRFPAYFLLGKCGHCQYVESYIDICYSCLCHKLASVKHGAVQHSTEGTLQYSPTPSSFAHA